MKQYKLIVLTNPVEGRDAEYNDWYTNTHLADVLRLPGLVAAQRFTLTEQQRYPGPHPWKYLAIYEVETDDIDEVVSTLKARSGTPEMPISETLHETRFACFYEPITTRMQSSQAA